MLFGQEIVLILLRVDYSVDINNLHDRPSARPLKCEIIMMDMNGTKSN